VDEVLFGGPDAPAGGETAKALAALSEATGGTCRVLTGSRSKAFAIRAEEGAILTARATLEEVCF
jgi:hypothetical protein